MVGAISILLSCLNPGIHLVLHSIVDAGHHHDDYHHHHPSEEVCHEETNRSTESKGEAKLGLVSQDCYLCSLVPFIQPFGITNHLIGLDFNKKIYTQKYSKPKNQTSVECLSLYDARAGPKLS